MGEQIHYPRGHVAKMPPPQKICKGWVAGWLCKMLHIRPHRITRKRKWHLEELFVDKSHISKGLAVPLFQVFRLLPGRHCPTYLNSPPTHQPWFFSSPRSGKMDRNQGFESSVHEFKLWSKSKSFCFSNFRWHCMIKYVFLETTIVEDCPIALSAHDDFAPGWSANEKHWQQSLPAPKTGSKHFISHGSFKPDLEACTAASETTCHHWFYRTTFPKGHMFQNCVEMQCHLHADWMKQSQCHQVVVPSYLQIQCH